VEIEITTDELVIIRERDGSGRATVPKGTFQMLLTKQEN
jgi:hypothetical protein